MYWRHDEGFREKFWREKLKGLSFADACRVYLLNSRQAQYITVQPVLEEEIVSGIRRVRYQQAVKRFLSADPDQNHCYSREELLTETSRMTGLSEHGSESLLHRLFAFQPELTYNNHGALCKPGSKPIPLLGKWEGKVSVPYHFLKKDLPDEWYISLQIPEEIIARMVWRIRKSGSLEPHPGSGRFAERILRLYKRRRGEFIREYSFESLKFLWLEYGSMDFPQSKVEKAVEHILFPAEGPVST